MRKFIHQANMADNVQYKSHQTERVIIVQTKTLEARFCLDTRLADSVEKSQSTLDSTWQFQYF